MKSYTHFHKIIIDKLKALTEAGATIFVDVYGTAETKPAGYPCAYVIETAGEGAVLDTGSNEREWQFEIVLMQEKSNRTSEEAVSIMRKITDKAIEMFDRDPQLVVGGEHQVAFTKVVPLTFDYTIRETPFIFARFLVACVDVVRNYP